MKRVVIDQHVAAAWVREVLGSGLSMATDLLLRLPPQPVVVALVGDDADPAQVRNPMVGGTGGLNPCTDLAHAIKQRWPEGLVVVEMPLARHGDPYKPPGGIEFRTCGEEIYAIAAPTVGAPVLERALRVADASARYVALIASPSGSTEVACPAEAIRARRWQLHQVLVGAFDGEGYLSVELQ